MSNVIGFAAALQALQARRSERSGRALTGYAGLGAYDDLVFRVQNDLTRAAKKSGNAYFDPKGADGVWGNNTMNAIRNFRAARGLPVDATTQAGLMDTPFLRALADFVAGTPAAPVAPRPSAAPAAGQPTPPPGTTADLPPLEAAKQWLLAPGAPVYKKPILYIGVGIVGLTLLLAMRSRE